MSDASLASRTLGTLPFRGRCSSGDRRFCLNQPHDVFFCGVIFVQRIELFFLRVLGRRPCGHPDVALAFRVGRCDVGNSRFATFIYNVNNTI